MTTKRPRRASPFQRWLWALGWGSASRIARRLDLTPAMVTAVARGERRFAIATARRLVALPEARRARLRLRDVPHGPEVRHAG